RGITEAELGIVRQKFSTDQYDWLRKKLGD
ncbi:unnamed protein product, partial [Rotaria sp. Silwood1]